MSAGEWAASVPLLPSAKFQSAPAAMRRENNGTHVPNLHLAVSIRSRRNVGGRMFGSGSLDRACIIRFQSAPAAMSAGESSRWSNQRRSPSFNPLPPQCRRENLSRRPVGSVRHVGFNPLPPNVGGRITARSRVRSFPRVSIRSRRMSAGEYAAHREEVAALKFQSAPAAMSAGECLGKQGTGPTRLMFQSAPAAMSAGECDDSHGQS